MAIRVGASTPLVKAVRVVSDNTQVKTVRVGRPVSSAAGVATTLSSLADVDISSLDDGAVIVYNSTSSKWEAAATLDRETFTLSGGFF